MQAFWEGFEKRAISLKDIGTHIGKAVNTAKATAKSTAKTVAEDVGDVARNSKRHFTTGLGKGVESFGQELGKRTADMVGRGVTRAAKSVSEGGVWKHLQNAGDSLGYFKKKKGLLESAGDAVKAHPYVAGGAGLAGLGGAGYLAGKSGKKSEGDYQYYNPYS